MEQIDTSGWKSFKIGDLFEKLQLGIKNENFNKTLDVSEVRTAEFNLPLVNAKHGNNGIMYYGREEDFETADMTIDIVQNGAIATGDVYAQPQKTGVLWDAYLIKSKEPITSEYVLMFIASVLEKAIKDKFSYDNKCVWDKASQLMVSLPVTSVGNPDYVYMDSYMRNVMEESESYLDSLMQAEKTKHLANTHKWKLFCLGGLFDVVKGTRLTKTDQRDGQINFISASSFNNGIAATISNDDHIHPGNTMTVSYNGSDIGRTFYQEEPFWASDDVNVLYPKFPLTKNIALFMAPIIKAVGGSHVYKNKWLQEDMKVAEIMLPVASDGNPDWDYMDRYMCDMLAGASASIDLLAEVAG